MSARRQPFTLDEHRQLARELHGMREELGQMWMWIANERLPKNHRAVRDLRRAYDQVNQARSGLEGVMFAQLGKEGGADIHIYYPGQQEMAAQQRRGGGAA
jgi:hypothetical protein